jgi:microcystin degradation protein MlrC
VTLRLAALGIVHEANTFALSPLDDDALERAGIERGPQIESTHATAQTTMAGFLGVADDGSIEVVPLIHAQPTPTGVIAAETFESFVGEMLALLEANGPWDGVLLALQGAAVAEGAIDADAEIASRVRTIVGPDVPIGTSLDLHANLSARLVEACDVTVSYRTNPHVDARVRASLCASILIGQIRGELSPVVAMERLPAAVEILRQGTSAEPMRSLMAACARAEDVDGILAASLTMGYPWADVPDMGVVVTVVADGDDALARGTAREIAGLAWSQREGFLGRGIAVDEAIVQLEVDAKDTNDAGDGSDGPLLLLDMGDNIGGGSPGDSVILLEAAIAAGVGGVLAIVVDPGAASAAATAGVGAQVELDVGASLDPRWGTPLRIEGRVTAISDGRFEEEGPSHAGQRFFDTGTSVALDIANGSVVVLNSKPVLPTSLEQVRHLGIDPRSFSVVIAKGVHSPLAAWLPISRRTVFVDTPGVTSGDLSRFEYRHRRKPLFPFEPDASFRTSD